MVKKQKLRDSLKQLTAAVFSNVPGLNGELTGHFQLQIDFCCFSVL